MNEHIEHCGEISSDKNGESADLSYWTGWNESYNPEWYPLGLKRLPEE